MVFRVLVRFVIGDSACDIPPEDRLDEYGCTPSPLVKPGTCIINPARLSVAVNSHRV